MIIHHLLYTQTEGGLIDFGTMQTQKLVVFLSKSNQKLFTEGKHKL